MKYLGLLFLISCGMNIKHQVSGNIGVNVPTTYTVNTAISPTTFEAMCVQKYQDIASSADRNAQIDQCISQNQAIVQQLINTLNGVPNPTPTPSK